MINSYIYTVQDFTTHSMKEKINATKRSYLFGSCSLTSKWFDNLNLSGAGTSETSWVTLILVFEEKRSQELDWTSGSLLGYKKHSLQQNWNQGRVHVRLQWPRLNLNYSLKTKSTSHAFIHSTI